MKWFKHMTRSLTDAKIEILIMKFGIEAYGVYFGVLEIIAGNLTSDNVTFEIEHNIELLAHKWKIDTIRLGHIIQECFNLELLELCESGHWACYKLVKYVDDTLSKNQEIKNMAKNPKYLEAKGKIGILIDDGDNGDPGITPSNSEELRVTPNVSDQTKLNKIKLNKINKNSLSPDEFQNSEEREPNSNFHGFIPAEKVHKTESLPLYKKMCCYWYDLNNKKRAHVENPKSNDFSKSKELCDHLNNDEEYIKNCIDFYWAHYENLGYYIKYKKHSFSLFASCISDVTAVLDSETKKKESDKPQMTDEEFERLNRG